MPADVHRVLEEHRVLDIRAADLERDLAGGQRNAGTIFERIAAYANLLSEHLLGEHQVLDEALGRQGSADKGATTFTSDLEALRWDWEEYLSVWMQDSATKDWPLFAEHSLALLGRIRHRIARENELLLGAYADGAVSAPPGARSA